MWCTVWSPLHGFGREIALWNRLVIEKIRARTFFVRKCCVPAVRENVFYCIRQL